MIQAARLVHLDGLTLCAALLWTMAAVAHGPLDHSARITLTSDGLELEVILGPDLAQQALAHGGIAPDQVRELLSSRGPSGHGVVSAGAFGALAGLRGPEGGLSSTRAIIMTDGLEYLFVADYPRPRSGPLFFDARYLEAVENAPVGSLALMDKVSGWVVMERLDGSCKSVELSLPPLGSQAAVDSPPASPGEEPVLTMLVATNKTEPALAATSKSIGQWHWWVGGVVVLGAAVWVGCRGRKRHGSS